MKKISLLLTVIISSMVLYGQDMVKRADGAWVCRTHTDVLVERGTKCSACMEEERQAAIQKEKEAKARSDAEAARKKAQRQTNDDDFWSGGEAKKSTSSSTSTTNNDFWRGTTTKAPNKSEDFWSTTGTYTTADNVEKKYVLKREHGQSWVEDENGNMLIPKGSYDIREYKDGLARIRKITGTEHHPEVRTITMYEYSYINAKGETIPPIRKTVSIQGRESTRAALTVKYTYYHLPPAEARAREAEDKRIGERVKREREAEDRRYQATLESVKSRYRAMGYEIE